jgi:sugar/nucleoside kinase (ribokinase family)
LHTTSFSATITTRSDVIVPAFRIKPLRATGAGDAWNAGNIFGYGNHLADECRLALANAASACYLSDPEGKHPTRQKLKEFIEGSDFSIG